MVSLRTPALLAFLALAAWPGSAAAEPPRFHTPTRGNQYVASMGKHLYVVWSLPRSLAPLAHLKTRPELEGFVARTAVHLCAAHQGANKKGAPDCLVHILKLHSNDEYNTAASAGFTTLGRLTLPLAVLAGQTEQALLDLDDATLLSRFSRVKLDHEKLPLPGGAR